MRYAIHHPDGSPYDCLTLEEIRKTFNKGQITKDYVVQDSNQATWQRVGVILGLERPGEESVAPPTVPSRSPITSRPLSSEENRGRWLLLVPLVVVLALDVFVAAVEILHAGITDLVPVLLPTAIRIFLSVVLMSAVWAGVRWARYLLVGLLLGVGLYLLYSVSSQFSPVLMFLAGVYLIGGGMIGFSKSVSSFLSFQRQGK